MQFIQIPTEQTSAVTDVVITVTALTGGMYLRRFRRRDPWKTGVWGWALMLLAVSAAFGAVIHGMLLPPDVKRALWLPLNLLLGFVMALFLIGTIIDWRGRQSVKRYLPGIIGFAVLFFGFSLVAGDEFAGFVLFAGGVLAFAFVVYAVMALSGRGRGSGIMAMSMAMSLAAAAIQAGGTVSIDVIWTFDHNGVFHLVQAMALGVLVGGVRAGLLEKNGTRGIRHSP